MGKSMVSGFDFPLSQPIEKNEMIMTITIIDDNSNTNNDNNGNDDTNSYDKHK